MKKTPIPKHLSAEARKIFKALTEEYSIDDEAGLRILQAALEARDRAAKARKQIDKDGMTIIDKFDQIKPHPLLANERDSRAAFLAGLKALNLEIEPTNSNFRGK